ncbi:MAG: hypothetical protein ACK4WH_05835, partial [Phycisphaerales bacterium]
AADRLLASSSSEARAVLQRVLTEPAAGATAPVDPNWPNPDLVVLRRIAAMSSAPPWLLDALKQRIARLDEPATPAPAIGASELRRAIIEAAASIRTRDCVQWLIEQAGRSDRSEVACRALARLTGRSEFGLDANRWALWFGQVAWLSDAEWRRVLAEGLASRADDLAAQRDRLLERVLASARRAYSAVESPADRSALLVQYLEDPQSDIRLLGLSLARQELANARRLDPNVGDAARRLLSDPRPSVRRDAVELVAILTPPGSPLTDPRISDSVAAISASLTSESDPEVAAALLRAAARWPDPDHIPLAIAWLASGRAVTVGPACELLDALRTTTPKSLVPSADTIAAALRAVMPLDGSGRPSSAGLRLLYTLGNDDDRDRVAALLRSPDVATRRAVAEAISPLPEAVDLIVSAAAEDAALFPAAAAAITLHRRSADGFRTLALLPADDSEIRRERLVSLSRLLTHNDLYRVASDVSDPILREAMLARLLSEPIASQLESPVRRTARPGVVAGLLLLFSTRVQLGQPSGALAAIDALTPVLGREDQREYDDRRTEVLVWLNRLDEAARLSASPAAWLRGLQHCIGLPHARAALAAFEARFGPGLSGQQAEEFAALRLAILSTPEFVGPPPPP